jgi:GTP-binding protein Era
LTDSNLRQIAAEYIRKHIIAAASQEVPHAVFVEIESYKETAGQHRIDATIHVETNGQRGIIIGKGGSVLAHIKKNVRSDMAKLTGVPVSLSCHIKVSPKWRDNTDFLRHRGISFRG